MPRNTGVNSVSTPVKTTKRRTLRTQPGDGVLELLRHGVRVAVGTQDVVPAGGERDEVGVERERGLDLIGHDLPISLPRTARLA
jgi:hypothetical protein